MLWMNGWMVAPVAGEKKEENVVDGWMVAPLHVKRKGGT